MRTLTVNARALSGVSVIFTTPSHGYRVSCATLICRPARSTSAVPAAKKLTKSPPPPPSRRLAIDIAGHRCHEPRDVAGAAGDAEPLLPRVLAVRLERIRIEERLAVERDAGDQPVVERALHDVDVLRVAMEQEQAVVPVSPCRPTRTSRCRPSCWATRTVGRSLAAPGRADAAGDVQLAASIRLSQMRRPARGTPCRRSRPRRRPCPSTCTSRAPRGRPASVCSMTLQAAPGCS